MVLKEMEKRQLFQVEGDSQIKVLNELYHTARYTTDPEQRKAAQSLSEKLRGLSAEDCMNLVKDIQSNYKLPYPPRTVGEMIAEARRQSGADKLKGHDIMALERFAEDTRHMIVFEVLSSDSPIGDKGDRIQQTVDLIRCKYSREFPLYNHTRDNSIIPKDVQDIPVKKVECRIVKIQSCRFESAVFFGKQEIPDVLAGKFFRAFAGIIQEIGNVVFITVNGTIFEVADFSGFFKLFYIFFIHNESSI